MALTGPMAADHVFVDSLGNRVNGARSMEAGAPISRCAPTIGFAQTISWLRTTWCLLRGVAGEAAVRLTANHGGHPRLGEP